MEDDLRRFNPKKFWAEKNNETQTQIFGSKSESKKIEMIIRFLKFEHFETDVREEFELSHASFVRYLAIMRTMREISIERRDCKGRFTYQIIDFRKIKPRF